MKHVEVTSQGSVLITSVITLPETMENAVKQLNLHVECFGEKKKNTCRFLRVITPSVLCVAFQLADIVFLCLVV